MRLSLRKQHTLDTSPLNFRPKKANSQTVEYRAPYAASSRSDSAHGDGATSAPGVKLPPASDGPG